MKRAAFCSFGLFLSVVAIGAVPVSAQAAPAPTVLEQPLVFTPGACVTYGDFYSCSGQLLNQILLGGNAWPGPYTPEVGPGRLQSNLVLGLESSPSGAPQNNDDVTPNADDGYALPSGAGAVAFSTKDSAPGGTPDPETAYPFVAEFLGDAPDFWDVSLADLIDWLTIGGQRHSLVAGFDHNQEGAAPDLLAWALAVVADEVGGGLDDVIFEMKPASVNWPTGNPADFSTDKTRTDDPSTTLGLFGTGDFVVSNGQICTAGPTFTNKSNCEAAGGYWANHNLGNRTDFLIWSPELDAGLETWLAMGYDTLKIRYDFRALNSGPETVYLLPVVRSQQVPEPGVIALIATGLLGVGFFARRRRRQMQ